MNIKHFLRPDQLERNSFLWSEVRLVVAAVALFLGGVPPAVYFLGSNSVIVALVRLAWFVSGAASLYLLYRWNKNHWLLFGKKDNKDLAAFAVSVVSGINLGLVALLGTNIGMTIASGRIVFAVAGLVYLVSAGYLWMRWQAFGRKLF